MNNIKKIDIFNISLHGRKIIEASAGTGKTFTIIILYLRLLLGIDNNPLYTRTFSVKEILIVTFTKTMQSELRERIKKNIYNFRIDCIKEHSKDPIFNILISQITNLKHAILLLLQAENQIDQASIFTIHGFCNHILHVHEYCSDILLKKNIIEDIYPLYYQVTCDFWRKQSNLLSKQTAKIIFQYWSTPELLLKDIFSILQLSPKIIKPTLRKKIKIDEYHEELIKIINTFKQKWLKKKENIPYLINNSNINKRIYHKNNIFRWINKITFWANNNTENYLVPTELKYFKQSYLCEKTKTGIIPKDILFNNIDTFLKIKFSLKEIFLFHALSDIPKMLKKEKKKQECLEFDDLLKLLINTLKINNLSKKICKKYPVALIDEFQDTNNLQYDIFKKIYKTKYNNNLLVLIGDPKQSIYSFRGASIFTYLKAKNDIKEQYFLNQNWRASHDMNHSINLLFTQNKNPFYLPQIKFEPTYSSNKNIKFEINGKNQSALRFFLKKGENICIDKYQKWIAKQCAQSIAYWLDNGRKGQAVIKKDNKVVSLQAKDITILVRNKNESEIIKKELKNVNINSYYYSNKTSIFHTIEAKEVLWILQSILDPNNEKLLKKAMSTNILGYNINDIDNLNKKYEYWAKLIKEFNQYITIWQEKGIFNMIKNIIIDYDHKKKYDLYKKNQYNIILILQLSELLQEKSRSITTLHALVFWLENKILYSDDQSKKNYTRSYYDLDSIKIVTFYKSKGLEYNITWIPFSTYFLKPKYYLYHSKDKLKTILNFNINSQKLKKAQIEYLSEDIRLLYVALTRSILHCSIGIAQIKKKNNFTDLQNSALEYIIQSGNLCHTKKLETSLKKLSINKCIELIHKDQDNKKFTFAKKKHKNIFTLHINRKINNNWSITSYSALKKIQISKKEDKILPENFLIKKNALLNEPFYTTHSFPKGKKYGIFLHNILKKCNFKKNIDKIWLDKELNKINLSNKWLLILEKWIIKILNTPLIDDKCSLAKLNIKKYIKELEFYLSIKNTIIDTKINSLIKYYDSISNKSPALHFNPITGMLTGSIDLVFYWKGKYYFIDYKSNWLGNSNHSYDIKKIKYHMIKNRYDIQYQLYCLALHRYLQQKIKHYRYDLHFGGTFFWFLRAIDNHSKNNGIFFTLPKKKLIKKLDEMF
ncbi:exodeoxyribonuclease V subunit beta [Buchnera aphidicola]|uniref:exodeoxyribonuclease V subunit beta n=1 Tax=Buchnera aphidicola TaxID=9 RepID=UPI003463F516